MAELIYEKIVRLGSENHGYVTTAQARQAGIDPAQLKLLAQRNKLERAAHAVYRVTALPHTHWDEFALAIAWSGDKGVISHESALVLHGLSDVNPSRIHMTVLPDSYPRARGGELYRLHRSKTLTAAGVTAVEGLPVTTVERTIDDCLATGSDLNQLSNAIEQARTLGLLSQKSADLLLGKVRGVQ